LIPIVDSVEKRIEELRKNKFVSSLPGTAILVFTTSDIKGNSP